MNMVFTIAIPEDCSIIAIYNAAAVAAGVAAVVSRGIAGVSAGIAAAVFAAAGREGENHRQGQQYAD